MDNTQIDERLEILKTIIKYSKVKTAIFTAGEIICINQERASLFELRDYNNGLRELKDCRQYKVSDKIEKKIFNYILNIIDK